MLQYVTYTQRVKKIIAGMQYPFLDFELNVNGSGYIVVRYFNNQYFQMSLTNEEMKLCPVVLADLLIANIENYFNGWAVRKGLRKFSN